MIEFELDHYNNVGFVVDTTIQETLGVSMTYMEFVELCRGHHNV